MTADASFDLGMLVRKLESIAPLSDEERGAILRLPATTKVVHPQQDIVRDKEQPTQSCLVLEGWAYRYKMLHEGKRQILSLHIPGDIPDLHSLHLPVMDHSLGALTHCRVALIPHEPIRELTLRLPSLSAALWRDTLVGAAGFREWMTGLGRRDAIGRLSHFLCELYLRLEAVGLAEGYRYRLPITQADMSDAMGLSNVHVNRVLQEMRGRELITLSGGHLTIHDWPALTRAAEFDPTYLHIRKVVDD